MLLRSFALLYVLLIGNNKLFAKRITQNELQEAQELITKLNHMNQLALNELALAEWAYQTNMTDENLRMETKASTKHAIISKQIWDKVKHFNWQKIPDYSLRKQFEYYAHLGESALPEETLNRLAEVKNEMEAFYSKAKICPKNKKENEPCDLSLEPDITEIMYKSEDPEELKHLWVEWRNAVGPKCRHLFKEYVELSNLAASMNNFSDYSHYWLMGYEDPNFKNVVQGLWLQLKPLYVQIHAYVRTKLREKYGDIVSEKGPIPAHLLGNMWAQSWNNIADFMLPHPNVPNLDITAELKRQHYTVKQIFKKAESFFLSLGLSPMPTAFWEHSMLEKPRDRDVVCHASAHDFLGNEDFRIKQCTEINEEHFLTAHHEMGHIQYFIQYQDQPIPLREGANDGFHEAIGDLVALSVQSMKHMKELALVTSRAEDHRSILNHLFALGLDKICFLPYGYLIDLWRWDIFSGKIKPEEYNCKWWELREEYQGIEPPVARSEEDFDPAAKYHIVADIPYLRYFIAFVLQYQFHRSLCEKAGEYEPNNPKKELHNCDIHGNTVAGDNLKKMLQLGSSKPWPDALEIVTGQRTMDASALLEYFKPLQKWLEEENKKNGAMIGWEKSKRLCTAKATTDSARSSTIKSMPAIRETAFLCFYFFILSLTTYNTMGGC